MENRKINICILDGYTLNPGDLTWDAMASLGNLKVYDRTAPENVVERAMEAEVLLVNKVIIGEEQMNALPNLKFIGVLATGYNNIDLDAARKHNIVVANVPAYSTESVAQMVFAHILNIYNNVGSAAASVRQGDWVNSADFTYMPSRQIELNGKTLGVVGLGNTGMATARIALGFGMKVIAYTSKDTLPEGMEKVTLDELFSRADIVSLNCPLTETTRGLVNRERIEMMKNNAVVINTGRGPLVNEQDLADALNAGRIMAVGVDVLSVEPPKAGNPLLTAKNCYVTPHIAWATVEARMRLMDIAVMNVRQYVKGENVTNRIC